MCFQTDMLMYYQGALFYSGSGDGKRSREYDADFHYVREGVSQFFDSGIVKRALDLIDKVGITGWEKWWQVHFAAWLAEHDSVGDWVMEELFHTDLRKNSQKDTIAIDIGFRLKGFSTKEMLFLELKQNNDWRRCVENMLIDAEKVYCAQSRSLDHGFAIRNFFVVGVYPTPEKSKKEIHDYIEEHANERDIPINREHIFTKYVRDTPFSVTLF